MMQLVKQDMTRYSGKNWRQEYCDQKIQLKMKRKLIKRSGDQQLYMHLSVGH